MKLGKEIELGIKAVEVLKSNGMTRTRDVAAQIGTTTNFLEQIMRKLSLAGIVSVKRGPGGGHYLRENSLITAYHVAQALGRDFGTISFEGDGTSRLTKSIAEAYLSVRIV